MIGADKGMAGRFTFTVTELNSLANVRLAVHIPCADSAVGALLTGEHFLSQVLGETRSFFNLASFHHVCKKGQAFGFKYYQAAQFKKVTCTASQHIMRAKTPLHDKKRRSGYRHERRRCLSAQRRYVT